MSPWDTGLGPEVTVKDGNAAPTPQSADKHRDASTPPKLTPLLAGVTVDFDAQGANAEYAAIDAVIKLRIDLTANVGPGVPIVRVEFGTEYVTKANKALPPMLVFYEETYPSSQVWRAAALTSKGFTILSEFGLTAPLVIRLRIHVVSAAAA